ncbi:hypothetical protein F4678DRAFT_472984 [Xylaria arbuscula]|nr:hypothetical protein F4678DRAFT_472984 [Xylaria arbuscula]
MLTRRRISYSSLLSTLAIIDSLSRYNVGVSKHTIKHYNPRDILALNNISTAFLATIYYPTLHKSSQEPKPYLEPELAAILEAQLNYTAGFLSFSDLLSATWRALVSHGYTVVGLDHAFEQPFIRFPNVDTVALLNYFPELVQELRAPFSTTHIGSFGYSLGGVAAVGSIYADDRLVSGLNLDGQLIGQREVRNDTAADTGKPVLFLGNGLHTGQDVAHDITWGTFPQQQTAYFGKFLVNGTMHHDFSDDTFWKTIQPTDPTTGPIDECRQVDIVNTYVGAFLDFALLGRHSAILDGPSTEWPEVTYYG